MPSGGRRRGKQGHKYPNRSDMRRNQAPKATGNQTYGDASQQLASQAAMPLSRAAAPVQAAGSSPAVPPQAAPPTTGGGGPPVIPSLSAPTSRPNEPLTAGLATGPGAGPEALNLPNANAEDNRTAAMLRGMYQAYPNSDLAALIAEMDARG